MPCRLIVTDIRAQWLRSSKDRQVPEERYDQALMAPRYTRSHSGDPGAVIVHYGAAQEIRACK